MAVKRKTRIEAYREFTFQMDEREVALGIEVMEDGSLQIGLTVLFEHELDVISSQEIDVCVFSDKDRFYDCTWRPPTGILPRIDFGFMRGSCAGYRFSPSDKSDVPKSVNVLFREKTFELDITSTKHRSDLRIPKPPNYFPMK
jgi:hypothetical protein